jgi:hypothetical protein
MPRRDEYDYDDDGRDDYDDYQYEDRPRGSRGRERAAERCNLPAIFMIITGCLGLLHAVARTAYDWTIGIQELKKGNVGVMGNNDPAMKDIMMVAIIVGPILNVLWSLIVLFGGIQLKRMRSRGFVIFASIFGFLPCSICCILGIPFGIWTLVVVCNDDVKRHFT